MDRTLLGLVLLLCLIVPGLALAQTPDTVGLFRPNAPAPNNTYYLLNQNALVPPTNVIWGFGNNGDLPVVGDWNGDGIVTIGLFRPNVPAGSNTFYLRGTNSVGDADVKVEAIGQLNDLPIVGDWDGNGTTTVGLFRPNEPPGSNTILLWNNNNTPPGPPDITIVGIGQNGDLPFVGKWGGLGPSSIGLIRSGAPTPALNTLFLWNGTPPNPPGAPATVISGIGMPGDVPIAGSWDGITGGVGLFRSGQPAGLNSIFFWNTPPTSLPFIPDSQIEGLGNAGADRPVTGKWGNSPPMVNPAVFNVPSKSPNGTNVGVPVTFSDPDAGQTYAFSITGGNTNGAFAINPVSGQITVNTSASVDVANTPWNLIVRVTDNGTPPLFGEAFVTINVTQASQTINFTSSAPTDAFVGGPTYAVTATATSGLGVTFAIDASASSVCSIVGSTVSFIGAGTCVINANQAGNANFSAAPQVQQSFAVKQSQTIGFTSTPPADAHVGGPTYGVTASATSGLGVTFAIDASASAVCSIVGSTVSFNAVGTCVINANQAGNGSFAPAPQVQQSFAVGQLPAITSADNTTFTVGTNGSFTVIGSGVPAPTFIRGGDALPLNVTFDTNTGALTGTPQAGTGKVYNLTFQAANSTGSSTVQSFTLTVNEGLAITSADNTTFTVGVAGNFDVTTSGFPIPTITRGSPPLPPNVTFTDDLDGTGTLAGTPTASRFLRQITSSASPNSLNAIDISGLGTRIVFRSQRDLTPGAPGNADGNYELFLYDIPTGVLTQLTNSTGGGSLSIETPAINAGGTRIVFVSFLPLTGGPANTKDLFLYDTGTSTLTALTNSGANGALGQPRINAAGTRIVFSSNMDLAPGSPGNADGNNELFLYDTGTSTLTQLTNTTGVLGSGSFGPSIDGPGTRIAFLSDRDLTPGNPGNAGAVRQVFLYDTTTATFTQVTSTTSPVVSPMINSGGTRIVFQSTADLTPGAPGNADGNSEIFLYDLTARTFTQVTNTAIGANNGPHIDAAGRTITFRSISDLTPGSPGNADGNVEAFSYDVTTGIFTQLTNTTGLNVSELAINGDGTRIALVSTADLTPGAPGNADANDELFLASVGAAGTSTMKFTASNGVSPNAVQDPFTLTVQQTPAITSANAVTFRQGEPGRFIVGTTGFPSPAITGGAGLPLNVTFADNGNGTGTLAGTPNVGTLGAHPTTFQATNAAGSTPVQNFTLTIGKTSQTIVFTSTPSSPVVAGPTYPVTATGGGSGNAVTFTIDASATSVCSIGGSTVSFLTAGTCVINANQAGNANFDPAPQKQQSFAVGKGSQTITFQSSPPGSAVVGGPTYLVSATASSSLTVTFTIDSSASSVCSIAGATVSFIGAGQCVINANQAGNANYNPAPQVQQSFTVGQGSQTINFTSVPPAQPTVGAPDYPVAANGGPSGNPVTFSTSTPAVCTSSGLNGSSISFVGPGNCVILADQAGNANYAAATQQQQSFQVKNGQTISFTSSPPPEPVVGAPAYPVTATSSALLTPVTFSSATPAVCTSGGTNGSQITFVGTGTCTINANQVGDANTWPAPQAQQSFTVKNAQAISFTSTPPNPALFQGPTYHVTATGGGSGNPVVFTIDGSSTSGCTINNSPVPNSVHFDTDAGTCVINANQAGNATFAPAPQAQQPFAVAPNPSPDGYNALGNVLVDSSIPTAFTVLVNDAFPAGTTIFNDFPKLSANGGNVTMVTAPGPTMGQFTYNPPVGFTGTDTFNYTLVRNSQSRQATVTFTITDNVWFINNNAGACPGAPCDGRQTNPFVDVSNFQAVNTTPGTGTPPSPTDNDKIFVYSSATPYSGALVLRNGQRLVGQGINGASTATRLNVTAHPGQTLPPNGGAMPALTSANATITVTIGLSNFIHGLNIGNGTTTATALSGSSFTALTINDQVAINTGGKAIDLATGALTANLNSVTSTGGGNNVVLSGITTPVTAALGSGALSGASSDALSISSQNGSFTYSGTITAGTSRAVNISGKNGGTVTLSGDINPGGAAGGINVSSNSSGTNTITFSGGQKKFSVGSGTAVNLATNTGAAITFSNGGLQITGSGSAVGFSATGGGTVTVGTGTNDNTISTATGTALNVSSTNIGLTGLTFKSISKNGGTNGIVLSSTGTTAGTHGGLTVTGDGTSTNNGSGGTIQNTSSHGISLSTTRDVSLDQLNISTTSGSGIDGVGVTNFSYTNGTITSAGNSGFDSAIAFNGSGTIVGNNIAGTLTVTGSTFTNPFYAGLDVQANDGTVTDANVSNNTISNPGFSGVNLVGTGTASTVFNLNNATINQNNISASGGNGVQISVSNGNVSGPGATAGIPGDVNNRIDITNNSISTDTGATQAITVANNGANGGSRTRTHFLIECNGKNTGGCTAPTANPITGSLIGTTVLVGNNGYSTMVGTINNNVIDSNHTPGDAGGGGNGIQVANGTGGLPAEPYTPDLTATVTSNVITDTNGNGILVVNRTGASGILKAKISSNTVAAPNNDGGSARQGIRVDAGTSTSDDDDVCVTISSNTSAGSNAAAGIGIRKEGGSATTNAFGITGLTPSPATGAQAAAFVATQNPTGGGVDNISGAGTNFTSCVTAPP